MEISLNSQRLFLGLLVWARPQSVDRLFQAEGFQRDPSHRSSELTPGRRRGDEYQGQVDFEDPDQVLRLLKVYQAVIDQYGRMGRYVLPAARMLLDSLERDGHYSVDGTLILLPSGDPRGPLKGRSGWADIDREISKLRWEFEKASEPGDFNAIGLRCARVLSILASTVFDPARHVADGIDPPGVADAKEQIACFLRSVAPGRRFENVRSLVKAAHAQANAVKHRPTAERVDAGVALAAIVLLAETLRLLVDFEREQHR